VDCNVALETSTPQGESSVEKPKTDNLTTSEKVPVEKSQKESPGTGVLVQVPKKFMYIPQLSRLLMDLRTKTEMSYRAIDPVVVRMQIFHKVYDILMYIESSMPY